MDKVQNDVEPNSNTSTKPVYSVSTPVTPAKFDITTFPNASMLQIKTEDKKVKKNIIPTKPLRPLNHIPQQMIIPEIDTIKTSKTVSHNYSNPSRRDKILRFIASIFGIIAGLVLLAAICINTTAHVTTCIEGICETYKCELTSIGNAYDTSLICLILIIISLIVIIVGIIFVQPYKIQKRICFTTHFARCFFILSFLLLLWSIIVFLFGDSKCYTNNIGHNGFVIGESIILDVVALIIVLGVSCIAM